MDSSDLPPRLFAVDVIACARADAGGLSRWIHGGPARRCAGASPAAMLLHDRVRVPAPDAHDAVLVARRGMLESAAAAGVQIGAVDVRVRPR